MRLLAIASQYPMYDRSAGDLRFLHVLRMLAHRHAISLACYGTTAQVGRVGQAETQRYRDVVARIGVSVEDRNPIQILRSVKFDTLLFEFYHSALPYLDVARVSQRHAVKVIDSVDVRFNRILSKAKFTKSIDDLRDAETAKRIEMEVYRKADHVIAVTREDRDVLLAEDPTLSIGIVPTIHVMQPLDDGSAREPNSLLFVGGFLHHPNADAAQYLCREIMPLVWKERPTAKLRIVGDSPPDAIRRLADDRVEVVGYVPDLTHYLSTSQVSVAPLRYGGGIKGKIGEAMAAGMPVVTTSTGIAGFGLTPGRDLLVGENPQDFSSAVVRLLRDSSFRETIRRAGWEAIARGFSPEIVEAQLFAFLEKAMTMPVRALSRVDRLKLAIPARLRFSVRQ